MKRQYIHKAMFVLLVASLLGACVQAPLGQQGAVQPQKPKAPLEAIPAMPKSEAIQPAPSLEAEKPQPLASTGFVPWLAYVGQDGNLWLAGGVPLKHVQITFDAAPMSPDNDQAMIAYHNPKWSPDGKLLAYVRQEGTPNAAGYYFVDSLWIYDQTAGRGSLVLPGQSVIGYDWKPGTHQLAFGQPLDDQYFGDNGPEAAHARGIRLLDAYTGEVSELVAPARGYHLVDPRWSPNGRFISAREATLPEGSSTLMVYDLQTSTYYPWESQKPAGEYSWSFDSDALYFDTLVHGFPGNAAIYIRNWEGGEPVLFSEMVEGSLSYMPRANDDGSMVAYLIDTDPLDGIYSKELVVVDLRNNEKRTIGTFDNILSMSWSAGWAHLLLSAGSYENATIYLVNPFDGSRESLAAGSQPAWNPAAKLQ